GFVPPSPLLEGEFPKLRTPTFQARGYIARTVTQNGLSMALSPQLWTDDDAVLYQQDDPTPAKKVDMGQVKMESLPANTVSSFNVVFSSIPLPDEGTRYVYLTYDDPEKIAVYNPYAMVKVERDSVVPTVSFNRASDTPIWISPNGDGRSDGVSLSVSISEPVSANVRLVSTVTADMSESWQGSWFGPGPHGFYLNGEPTPHTLRLTPGKLKEGAYDLVLWGMDEAGNVSKETRVPVQVDLTPPQMSLSGKPTLLSLDRTRSMPLKMVATDNAGILEIRLRLMQKDAVLSQAVVPLTGHPPKVTQVLDYETTLLTPEIRTVLRQSPGDYVMEVSVTDRVGNITRESIPVRFDSVPPVISKWAVSKTQMNRADLISGVLLSGSLTDDQAIGSQLSLDIQVVRQT
ncbi:MAG: hypothetical protein AAB066_04760, partial [Candidatus Margulisiibacteriota bacterium]